jgi:hypothetical protein
MEATTTLRLAPSQLVEHGERMHRLALVLIGSSLVVGIAAPIVSLYLGILVPVAIVGAVVGASIWRRAHRQQTGLPRVVTFRGRTITEGPDGAPEIVDQPVLGARAFARHLEVIAGTTTPKVSVHQIEVPYDAEERLRLMSRLRSEHGIAVVDKGPYARHLLWAFTVVPTLAIAVVLASRIAMLVLAYALLR